MHGSHVIKSWSTNQAVIALSSGEAEYYGMVKGASVALGIKALSEDLGRGYDGPIEVRTDASAAIGIANRIGVGKVRHIEVNQLWLQDKVHRKEIKITKVKGEDHLADALTKPLDQKGLLRHIEGVGAQTRQDRHPLMPKADYCIEDEWDADESMAEVEGFGSNPPIDASSTQK